MTNSAKPCSYISISGGTITATGGQNAAGIGSCGEGTCGTITIGGTEYYNDTSKTWASTELENALKATTFTWP